GIARMVSRSPAPASQSKLAAIQNSRIGGSDQLADRFHETNQSESIELRTTDLILRRPPSWAAVSKDGHGHGRASGHPSRRAQERALQDEVGARHRYDSNFRNTLLADIRGLHSVTEQPREGDTISLPRYLALSDAAARRVTDASPAARDTALLDYFGSRKTLGETIHRFFADPGLNVAAARYAG